MGLKSIWSFVSFFLVLSIFNIANGQGSVNEINDSLEWNYNINLNTSGRLITGTFNQLIFSPKLDLDFNSKQWNLSSTTSYHFNQTNGHKIEDNWYKILIVSYFVKGQRLFPTVLYSYEKNLMFRVNSRHLAGLGLSAQKEWNQNFIRSDLGAGYENTNFNGTDFKNSNSLSSQRNKEVLMFRLVHRHLFWSNRMSFYNMVFYRHSLRENQDIFIRTASAFSFKIAKNLSTSVSFIYRLESVYLKSLSRTNKALLFGLAYEIKSQQEKA